MLVISRKTSERVLIGKDITVTVMRIRGGAVRLGIEAPADVRIVREELAPERPEDKAIRKNMEGKHCPHFDPDMDAEGDTRRRDR